MADQPNPYSQPEKSSGVPIGEAKPPLGQRGIWFWLSMGCVVSLALIGLATLGLVTWAFFNLRDMGA